MLQELNKISNFQKGIKVRMRRKSFRFSPPERERERVKYRASPEGINFEKLFIRFLSLINSDYNLVNAHHKGNIIENQVVGN